MYRGFRQHFISWYYVYAISFYLIISFHFISYHFISYRFISNDIISCPILAYAIKFTIYMLFLLANSVMDIPWTMETRMMAEKWLLQSVSTSQDSSHHYCVHHTHQNMYDCPTPRWTYVDKPEILIVRNDSNCHRVAHDVASDCRRNGS